ncbi:hypothetical protein IMCC3317_11190 [Kordia antarctica]|uniref:Uncharacterized protein n=1 Tax=Kordia antarctica TaxID=1218801 RepID=A0A7L4ZH40_9FLAO|nr:hypothetical protein [Kordia antarctica]QHI35771.1 hypothetical protein IMCC3317_11190 [Kordia antarctica]
MKAETAYNVIKALSQDELLRLYEFLGVEIKNMPKKLSKRQTKKEKIIEAMEKILVAHFSERRLP